MSRLSAGLRRERLNLILIVVLIGLTLNVFYTRRGLRDLLVLRHHGVRLEADRERLSRQHLGLEREVKRLQSDDRYLQRLIRQQLEYARPGELIYRFPGDEPSESN